MRKADYIRIDLTFANANWKQRWQYILAILKGRDITIEIGGQSKSRGLHHGMDISKSMLRRAMDQQSWN